MYSYLVGNVTEVMPQAITLEVNNVGFYLIVANPFAFKVDEFVKVFVYQKVSDDAISLYGFKTIEEKNLFLQLISVTGIGPKSALSILATGSVNEIYTAINDGNAKYLTKFPGIGAKASAQIILDLKGKIVVDRVEINSELEDVKEALIALGYKEKDVDKVLPKLSGATNEMIKQALKLMLK